MDILRVLTTPDLEVRKKTLQLALDLVSSRNVEEVSQLVPYKPDFMALLIFHATDFQLSARSPKTSYRWFVSVFNLCDGHSNGLRF